MPSFPGRRIIFGLRRVLDVRASYVAASWRLCGHHQLHSSAAPSALTYTDNFVITQLYALTPLERQARAFAFVGLVRRCLMHDVATREALSLPSATEFLMSNDRRSPTTENNSLSKLISSRPQRRRGCLLSIYHVVVFDAFQILNV